MLEATVFPLRDNGDEIIYDEKQFAELTANVRTAAFGMGIGTGEGAAQALARLLETYQGTLIVDADGLTLLSRIKTETVRNAACRLILTPHVKEFSRLTGLEIPEILDSPAAYAEAYAKETGAVVLLKGLVRPMLTEALGNHWGKLLFSVIHVFWFITLFPLILKLLGRAMKLDSPEAPKN